MMRSMYTYMKFSKNKFRIYLTLNICVCIHADRQTDRYFFLFSVPFGSSSPLSP